MGLAIVYARVSTEEQAEHGHSLAAQLESCRQKAAELGATETVELVDDGVSGEILDRPALSRAREIIRAGAASAFVCFAPDRLARKLGLQILLTEEIEKAGARLVFVNFEREDNPQNNLFYQIRGAIGEYEKALILERTAAGRKAAAKAGRIPVRCTVFGYVQRDGRLEVVPEAAGAIRRVFALAGEGKTDPEIARTMMDEGIAAPGGDVWYPQTVRRILDRDAYYTGKLPVLRWDTRGVGLNRFKPKGERVRGRLKPREEWIEVDVPVIVGRDEWAAAHAMNDMRGRRGKTGSPSLLHALCTCGVCGSPVHFVNGSGSRKYYRCGGRYHRTRRTECNLPNLRAERLEGAVWRVVREWLAHPEALATEVAAANRAVAARAQRERQEIARLLAGLATERERVLTAFARGWITEAEVERHLGGIGARRARLERRLAEVERSAPTELDPRHAAAIRAIADSYGRVLDDLAPDDKRRLIAMLVRGVTVLPHQLIVRATIPEPEASATWPVRVAFGRA